MLALKKPASKLPKSKQAQPLASKTPASQARVAPSSRVDVGSNLQQIRLVILNALLKGLSVLGAPLVVILLSRFIPQGEWGIVIFYTSAYLWVLWITFDQKLPYSLRAVGLVLITYILALAFMLQEGFADYSPIWMLAFSTLTTLLLGLRMGLGAIALDVLTLAASSYLVWHGLISSPNSYFLGSSSWMDWVWGISIWLLMAIALSLSLHMLIQGFTRLLEKEKTLGGILASDREQTSRRARELDRRLLQIRTAAEVSRSLSALLEPKSLLQQVVDLVQERFKLYHVGVYLLDEKGDTAILSAATGDAGQDSIAQGSRLEINAARAAGSADSASSVVAWSITNRQPRLALDAGREPVRFSNPLLPLTRSEMALPLISGEQVFGAMTVQSDLPDAFDQDDLTVMQGIADSLAISLHNAQLFEQRLRNLQEIQALNRQYIQQAWKPAETPSVLRAKYENEAFEGLEEMLTSRQFPILLRDQVIGQIALDTDKKMWSPEEQTLIQEVTTQAALAMENIRLLEQAQRKGSLERMLGDIVRKVRLQTDMEGILRATVGELGSAFGATEAHINLTAEFLSKTGDHQPQSEASVPVGGLDAHE
ncbi:MAG TPA: GAF domain-containing protein [Anaerolineales bacterium]|nr:GAF domain-containing protein [Anaerolineales bacterium]